MRTRLFGTRRRTALTSVAAVLVLALIVLLLALPDRPGTARALKAAAASPSSTATPSPSQSTTGVAPTPTATESVGASTAPPLVAGLDPEQSKREAEAALRSFLDLSDQTYRAADGELAPGLGDVATGFALGEVQATASEFKDTGARQTGGVTVDDLVVAGLDLSADPPTVTMTACLNTTEVDVLNIDGSSAKQGRPVTTSKTLHIFGVQYADAWRVATHSFPDNANCS